MAQLRHLLGRFCRLGTEVSKSKGDRTHYQDHWVCANAAALDMFLGQQEIRHWTRLYPACPAHVFPNGLGRTAFLLRESLQKGHAAISKALKQADHDLALLLTVYVKEIFGHLITT